jgi:hypothetical protein
MPMSGQIALACSVNHSDCVQIVARLYDHAQAVNAVVDANGGSAMPLRPSNPRLADGQLISFLLRRGWQLGQNDVVSARVSSLNLCLRAGLV